jgi:hypothetical protein
MIVDHQELVRIQPTGPKGFIMIFQLSNSSLESTRKFWRERYGINVPLDKEVIWYMIDDVIFYTYEIQDGEMSIPVSVGVL